MVIKLDMRQFFTRQPRILTRDLFAVAKLLVLVCNACKPKNFILIFFEFTNKSVQSSHFQLTAYISRQNMRVVFLLDTKCFL